MNPLPCRSKTVTDCARLVAGWQARFDDVLDHHLPPEDTEPRRLHQAMRYSVLASGKRFRPVLVYAAGRALGLGEDVLDPPAAAIELIHAYSLIHDDLPAMDDDDLRRGRPTCHRAFDEATAILAGDALQALAFEVLARELPAGKAAGENNSIMVVQAIAAACGSTGMAGGQALDLGAVGLDIDEESLKTMHRLKTGALIKASVVVPCMLADSNENTLAHMSAFGECIGLAFQIHDDILDVTGDIELTGKNTLSDAAQDKPTFPSLLGLEESMRQARRLRDRAIAQLEEIPGDTSVLAWLADYVIQRDR
jgi:farnesyl diphosphate synthase